MNHGGYDYQGTRKVIMESMTIGLFQCLSCKRDIWSITFPEYCPYCGKKFTGKDRGRMIEDD